MIVRCWKCNKTVTLKNKSRGKIMEIVSKSGMLPKWKNQFDSAAPYKWECKKHYVEEKRTIPLEFQQVLNKEVPNDK